MVRYRVPVTAGTGVRLDVELRYQPIAYRWAQNLSGYKAEEPQRFVGYYNRLASASSVVVGTAAQVIP